MAIRIAVDVMGADRPPYEIVRGALAAARRLPLNLVFTGRRKEIEPHLDPDLPAEVVDCQEVIRMDEPPMKALRKKDSSLLRGIKLLAEGRAEAFISPGNTGAVVAAAIFTLGRIPGILRPGLCAQIPTLKGRDALLIDVGATVDCKPQHLVQFAGMGQVYAREALGVHTPRVGLLNIGTEEIKGDKTTREAFRLLSRWENFVGNVEPHELVTERPADIVASCGFTGNLALKALEGGAEMVLNVVRQGLGATPWGRVGALLLRGGLRKLRALGYERHNGAPLLGVKGTVLVAHGRSSAPAIEAAVERAFWIARLGLVERLEKALS